MTGVKTTTLEFPRPGGMTLVISHQVFPDNGETSVAAYLTDGSPGFVAFAISGMYYTERDLRLWVGNTSFKLSADENDQVREHITHERPWTHDMEPRA